VRIDPPKVLLPRRGANRAPLRARSDDESSPRRLQPHLRSLLRHKHIQLAEIVLAELSTQLTSESSISAWTTADRIA
jgi:hypothetical protein